MEQNNKKIIMDIVPKKGKFNFDVDKKKDNDFLNKLKDSRSLSSKKSEEKIIYEKKQMFSDSRSSFIKKGFIILVILIFLIAGFTYYILSPASLAVIKITPNSKIVSINSFLKAAETEGDIPLSFIKLRQEKEEKIPILGLEKVSKKASGKIVIYNSFSASSQTLIKSTRFESSNGKIFRIEKPVIVPGMKTINGKKVPGSIEAMVYAEISGDEYNIALSDFTIPGFKGTAKFNKFYARSKTQITGGYSGVAPKIKEEDVIKIKKKLKEELEQEAFSKILNESDNNAVLLKDGLLTNFSSEISLPKNNVESALIRGVAEISVPVLKKDKIFDYLVKKYLNSDESSSYDYYIKNFNSLSLKIVKNESAKFNSDNAEVKEITIKIEGNAIFLSKINEVKLKSELISERDITKVFKSHSEIENAKVLLSPFLKRKMPQTPDKIKIQIEE